MHDPINHPAHYTGHPSGVEAIQICEHMNFCRGNAMKYIFRAGLKGDEVEDLRKAVWYLQREINRIIGAKTPTTTQSGCSGGGGGKSIYQNDSLGLANVAFPPETKITVNGKTFELKDIDKEMSK